MTPLLFRLLLLGTLLLRVAGTNLLGNGDLEAASLGPYLSTSECSVAISTTEKHGGAQSVHITGRTAKWAGLGYKLGLSNGIASGKIYAFSGYLKLENLAQGFSYHNVTTTVKQTFNDNSQKFEMLSLQPLVRTGSWIEIGGDFKLLVISRRSGFTYRYSNRKSTTSLMTEALSLTEPGISLSGIDIEAEQNNCEFGHGTAVKASLWTDASYGFYRDFVTKTLKSEWAVIENDLKWRGMEWTQGTIKFTDANATIDDLLSKGISVRGHNMFWSVEKRIPKWVQSITDKDTMKTLIQERISDAISLTKGRLAHWDVCNEALHGDFYERKTGNVDITMDMFREMHKKEPSTQLFLNDFAVVNSGTVHDGMSALSNQAKSFLDAQVPLHGVGLQSHLPPSDIDITQLKYRLDKIAEAGLPMWITEMSVTNTNDTAKAQTIEDALTLYFSHKMVKGVILWGFWSGAIYDTENALATGTDSITLNEAGQRYVDLVNTKWRTNWIDPVRANASWERKCFKGDYTISVKKNGETLKTFDLSLTTDRKLILWLQGTTGKPLIKEWIV
ncbi:anti-sigma-I factor RsgI6-like [Pecten maximus]|uniref:anti-sigma-I factor RsgI6-like n=1 Tax=Pecten maximus TaxID=6579 RepID=UPI001458FCB8|nr:anti-sigma-I factor RsgI6-like [Pecten maximus]